MNAAWSRALAVVCVAAAAAVLAGPDPAAVVGGLLLTLVLPGMAVTAVLFRGRDLSAVERVLLAPALSMALLIISGLLMYAVGIDLDRVAWTTATAGVTLFALLLSVLPARGAAAAGQPAAGPGGDREPAIAAARAARAALSPAAVGLDAIAVPPAAGSPGSGHTAVSAASSDGSRTAGRSARLAVVPATAGALPGAAVDDDPPRRRGTRQTLLLALAAALLLGAGALSYVSARDSFDTPVTTLSAAPPGPMTAAGLRTVTITATGLLPDDGPYALQVTGENRRRLDQRAVPVGRSTWTGDLIVPGRQRVTVSLYRAGQLTPHRSVIIAALG